ncbi:hypothetical protein HN789_07050 [archaeon]|jgi:hypothetical protein|nr:hypothetical protein [archaeon]MBT4022677.1 hypothetical protein [archaeon]MBT4273129.1 hypothetical protein [archaeon]MBT4461110.1 hypothetical protein [archaeon]MBT4858779.1 hypothetical protein [archaeon]
MKALVFDTGPLINLSLNNLLHILKPLKEKFKGEFYITNSVKRECIDRPLTSKKFKFEALQILKLLQEGVIKIYDDPQLKPRTLHLLKMSNNLFKVHDNYIKNVQYAEVEVIVAYQLLNANAVVIDEFVTRMIIENTLLVKDRMERKLHERVFVDKENVDIFKDVVKNVKVIRSLELVSIAYEMGLFEEYYLNIQKPKKTLLEAILWAIKLNGCSSTEEEIKKVLKIMNV